MNSNPLDFLKFGLEYKDKLLPVYHCKSVQAYVAKTWRLLFHDKEMTEESLLRYIEENEAILQTYKKPARTIKEFCFILTDEDMRFIADSVILEQKEEKISFLAFVFSSKLIYVTEAYV